MSPMPPVLEALAWALLHFVWQGLLVAGVLALLRAAGRDAAASIRYGAACGAMAACTALVATTFAVTWSRLSVPGELVATAPFATAPASALDRWIPALLVAWSCGVTWLTARWLVGWLRLRTLLRRDVTGLDASWQRRFRALARRVGVTRPVRVLVSARSAVPLLAGCWRPVILVPAAALTGLPAAYLECALVHELVHLRRFDPFVHLLQRLVDTLLFYHPAVWWISRTVSVEREHACDERVVDLLGDRLGYARALAELEALRSGPHVPALAATGGPLLSRIRRILSPPAEPARRSGGWLVTVAAVLLTAALAALGTVHVPDSAPANPDDVGIAWLPERLRQWQPLIEDAASHHGVDPDLLAIVTLLESGGDPDAVSSRGAVGLMQVMPTTAALIAEQRGIDGFDVTRLGRPEVNVDFGAWYLARQLEAFAGSATPIRAVELAAAAYNGGPGQLRAHLADGRPLSEETARYKTLVRELWRERDAPTSATLDRMRRDG